MAELRLVPYEGDREKSPTDVSDTPEGQAVIRSAAHDIGKALTEGGIITITGEAEDVLDPHSKGWRVEPIRRFSSVETSD